MWRFAEEGRATYQTFSSAISSPAIPLKINGVNPNLLASWMRGRCQRMCLTVDWGFDRGLHWPCVSSGDHRTGPGTQRLGSEPIAWRLSAWPIPARHSLDQPHPSSPQPPPPRGLPAPPPAVLF
ncbi:unnamed protein product [Pleuronectes platessa]|uniref:Uncharacterized protein n=1 Tax=Pleuronectes platessa TaxID=8262 RepID=A0A9N7Z6H3_PLEPL|nr:unnamed protein product [Pleuronectes platessa]